MSRYQGVNRDTGMNRGRYRAAKLETEPISFDSSACPRKRVLPIGHEIRKYLITFAQPVSSYGDLPGDGDLICHYGGATLIYKELFNQKTEKAIIAIRMASNDSLDDVVERLRSHFPQLKQKEGCR